MHTIERVALAIVISLEERRSLFELLRQLVYVDIELVSQFALGLLGAILANVSIWALPLIIPPLLVVYRSNQRQVQLRKQTQDLEYQAFHDPLTGLPNRALFLDRVQHALRRTFRRGGTVAVLFLDLDQFKYINDSLGHDAGDQLLQGVAQRLLGCVRPADTVARLGGDEFTLLLENIESADQAIAVVERIKRALLAPFAVAGEAVFVAASIGITFSDDQHAAPHDLMRQADAAMYKAKEHGRACYQIFDARKDARALTRLQWETELRHALERREFAVYYQPLVDLGSSTIVGFEALVRWRHPEHGLVPPAQFIPLAEDTGLILPLGQLVLRTACQQAQAWLARLPAGTPLRISVNLSARQFQHAGLVDDVAQALRDTGLAPHHLQLEITESVVMHSASVALATLQKLKHLGVQLAIDDFGTGYSSLSYLKHFPVDTLKIDRTFVECLDQDSANTAIAQAIITLAHTLELHTVAEGVETRAQQQALQALGCEFGQGFFWAQPLPHDAAVVILEDSLATKALSVADPF
jgi:diguanylate cyclase (GGDEF)-like protein